MKKEVKTKKEPKKESYGAKDIYVLRSETF